MARNQGVLYPPARRFPVKLPRPNSVLIVALVLLAVTMIIWTVISSEGTSFTGVKGKVDTASVSFQVQPEEPQAAPAPVTKEWPQIEDGRWTYTLNVGSVPLVDDPIYNGQHGQGTGCGGGTTGFLEPGSARTKCEIAKFLVPGINEEDVVGLSIAKGRDDSSIVLAAVDVMRDIGSTDPAVRPTLKTQLFLSVDGLKTAKEIPISFMDPKKYVIDDVIVTGTSPVLVAVRPFSSHGYWQREILP